MKYLIPFVVLMACEAPVQKPDTIPAPNVNGKASYMVAIPVRDEADPQSITPYDQDWILRTEVCPNGFQDTKIEYTPLSDDGVSTKLVTFYCL